MDFCIPDIFMLLSAQVMETEYSFTKYIIGGVIGLAVIVVVVLVIIKSTATTHYDLDGVYGGGPGLRRIFRHKRLKAFDRDGLLRGKSMTFKDIELEKLLAEDKLSEATAYLTGILNAAKEAGDKYTRERYAKYSEEIIARYDKLADEETGGKAVHVKK